MSIPRVFASVPALLLGFAESLGLSRDSTLTLAGLRADDLADPDALVPYESLVAIWGELTERFPGAPLGARYAAMWSLDGLGIIGYVIRNAANGHDAIRNCLRFSRLVDPFLRFDVVRRGDEHVISLDHEPRVVAMREPLEMLVLATVRMAQSLYTPPPAPTSVCFRHAAQHAPEVYAPLLGADVPVRFGQRFDGIVFPSALLDLPIASADPRVASYLVKHAESLLAETETVDDAAPIEVRVRQAIDEALSSGNVDAATIARRLGTSVRSLQRELGARGTTFSDVLDDVRRTKGLALLARADLTVAEVAFMLGYAESRVFHRSFRRWTGKTPTEWRRAR
ncbi:MAG: AraC family transcriptional regulator [Deltaproteobacteria bacterium]|nr:AraC family transcriptional regulator [Deltaproteobacteria bacterium]